MIASNEPDKLAYQKDLEEKFGGGVFKLHGLIGMVLRFYGYTL